MIREIFIPITARLEALSSRPHNHVPAMRQDVQQLGIESVKDSRPNPIRNRILAPVTARILDSHSKLATTR